MIFRVFSVFDDKANNYMPPFFQHTAGMAMRVFSDATRQADHPFHLNPEDYHLYELGVFDDESGLFTNEADPALLLRAKDVVASYRLVEPQEIKLAAAN